MDFEQPKRKKGALLVKVIMLLIFPLVCYIVCKLAIMKYQKFVSPELNDASARALGFGMGTIFHITCFIIGAFKDSIAMVAKRMSEFKENLPISFGFAVKCYLEDMRDDGIAFLVEMGCMIGCFLLAVNGLLTAIQLL